MIESKEPSETTKHRIQLFADRLSAIRGSLSYREMERKTGCSHENLQAAAAGKKFPDWKTVEYYVTACGDDINEWRAEWQAISAMLDGRDSSDGDTAALTETADSPQDRPRSDGDQKRVHRPRPAVLIVGSIVIVAAITAVAVLVFGNNGTPETDHGAALAESTSGQVTSTTATTSSGAVGTHNEPPNPSGKSTESQRQDPGDSVPTVVPTGENKPPMTGGEDPDRPKDVQEQRVVELVQEQGYNWVDIEYWRHDYSTPGELQINTQEVSTNLGAKLTIIPDTPLAGRARCAQATGWRDRVSFSELHIGSQLCALSHVGNYASMEVRLLPDSSANNGRFTFYGITWWS